MQKKIALEEHCYLEGFPNPARDNVAIAEPDYWNYAVPRLPEFDEVRLGAMDAAGIEIAVLSLFAPGTHAERDAKKATDAAKRGNDQLAAEIARHPARYRGFAALAMHDAKGAAEELERTVKSHGFKGALINGQTQGVYLDDERYLPFWERVAALDVPIYLHPGDPMELPAVYQGYPGLGRSIWGWMGETGGHALRLVFSGLFERYPTLSIVLGHMGEALPFLLWRIDSRYGIYKPKVRLKKKPSEYILANFYATTAGNCAHAPLACTLATFGEDRVMFSVDYPLEKPEPAAAFMETAPVSDAVRGKLCWDNAARLMKI